MAVISNMNISEELKTQLEKREYGEHIVGARKDDYAQMSEEQRMTSVKKDKIWKTLDTQAMHKEGMPCHIIVLVSDIRRWIQTTPASYDAEICREYVENVSDIRDRAMKLRSYAEAQELISYIKKKYYSRTTSRYQYTVNDNCIFSKWPSLSSECSYKRKADKQGTGLTKEEQLDIALRKKYVVYFIDDSISFNKEENQIEIRKPGIISFYTVNEMPKEDVKGKFLFINSRTRTCRVFDTLEEAEDFRNSLIAKEKEIESTKPTTMKKKVSFKVKELTEAKRVGPDYIRMYCPESDIEAHATGDLMEEVLGFDKGQYGNYVSVAGMIDSLDSTFNAALDLAQILNMPKKALSFNGNLGLAFGARGRSAALAHYEPDLKVINITYDLKKKTTKSGCFAHEWAHALDNYIGKRCALSDGLSFATDSHFAPEEFKNLVNTMKYKEVYVTISKEEQAERLKCLERYITSYTAPNRVVIERKAEDKLDEFDRLVRELLDCPKEKALETVNKLSDFMKQNTGHVIRKEIRDILMSNKCFIEARKEACPADKPIRKVINTDFYEGSQYFDKTFTKNGNGYWTSNTEMFARAFEAYVEDKLKEHGLRSDYLAYRADGYCFDGHYASPQGDERKKINECFDKLFDRLRKNEFANF